MPYPNEHAARLIEPSKFEPDSFRRENDKFGKGIHAIFGKLKGEDSMTLQTLRFDSKEFTEEQAKEWLDEHDYSPIDFEPAIEIDNNAADIIIENVDICRAGTTVDGREVSKSRLEKVYQNTLKMLRAIPNFRISVKPEGHWHNSEKIIAYADNIRRVGNRIVADIITKSKDIIRDIKSKSFIAPSAEISSFKEYGEVISGVALIGNSIPAFPDLQGLHSAAASGEIYCMTTSNWIPVETFFSMSNKSKEMEEFFMEELKKEIFELKDKIIALTKDSQDFKSENDNLKKENETLKGQVDAFKKSITEKKTADINAFVSKLIESGKASADKKDKICAHFSSITDDTFSEELIKDDIFYSAIMSVKSEKKSHENLATGQINTPAMSAFSSVLDIKKESYEAFEKSNGLKI